nr:unnamed protein product [Digitaria exilis]
MIPPAADEVAIVLRPSADLGRVEAASLPPASFLSLKNPNTGREQTGTLSTTGVARTPAEYDRSITRERDRIEEWTLPAGELELRSRPWNTIFPEAFIRGESTDTTLGCGGGCWGVDGRRLAGLWPARAGAAATAAVEVAAGGCGCGGGGGCERTRRRRGRGVGSTESREWRAEKSSWSWTEEDDDEREKREEAREREVSESELSRRSGAAERSDEVDARAPLFRWRSSSFSDLAAEELDALDGVAAVAAAGDADGDAAMDVFCGGGVWTFLSRRSSRHRLEHVGALGENTYGSIAASAAAGSTALTRSGVDGGISATSAVSRRTRSTSAAFPTAACGRSGRSFPSAKSSSAGSMVAAPPRLNSKSMKSLEIAAGSFATGSSSTSTTAAAAAAAPPNERRGGPSHPNDMAPPAVAACTLLATAEAIAGGGEEHPRAGSRRTAYHSSILYFGGGRRRT